MSFDDEFDPDGEMLAEEASTFARALVSAYLLDPDGEEAARLTASVVFDLALAICGGGPEGLSPPVLQECQRAAAVTGILAKFATDLIREGAERGVPFGSAGWASPFDAMPDLDDLRGD